MPSVTCLLLKLCDCTLIETHRLIEERSDVWMMRVLSVVGCGTNATPQASGRIVVICSQL
jgi:hypothetical protein